MTNQIVSTSAGQSRLMMVIITIICQISIHVYSIKPLLLLYIRNHLRYMMYAAVPMKTRKQWMLAIICNIALCIIRRFIIYVEKGKPCVCSRFFIFITPLASNPKRSPNAVHTFSRKINLPDNERAYTLLLLPVPPCSKFAPKLSHFLILNSPYDVFPPPSCQDIHHHVLNKDPGVHILYQEEEAYKRGCCCS